MHDSVQLDTRKITANFVYTHPSVSCLAAFVLSLVSVGARDSSDGQLSQLARINVMRDMASKYSHDFSSHRTNNLTRRSGNIVLVTGTTGGLGSYILSQLASDANVSKVYAFNRKSQGGSPLLERQTLALLDRGLDPAILEFQKVILLEGDLLADNFGLSRALYDEVSIL